MAKLLKRVPSLKYELASPFRVTPKTIEAWARPKESDPELMGTGKGNPLDRVEKLLEETHPYDPEMAREIAEHFPSFVDELDRRAGVFEAEEDEHPCRLLAKVLEQNTKLILSGLGGCDDPKKLSEVFPNVRNLKTYVLQLEGCIERLLSTEETIDE